MYVCVCVCLFVSLLVMFVSMCDVKSQNYQKPCHPCQTFSELNVLLKVLLVLRYQGSTGLGP